jgi:hypothetical protein
VPDPVGSKYFTILSTVLFFILARDEDLLHGIDPGSGAFLTKGAKIRDEKKNPNPGSEIQNIHIPDRISKSLLTFFGLKILNFFVLRIRDPVLF